MIVGMGHVDFGAYLAAIDASEDPDTNYIGR